jgi:hypothetical protein
MAEQVIQGWSETEMENLRRMWEDMAILDHNTWVEDMKIEARQQQLLETARRFKALGLDPEQIAAGTGLSAQEIAAL